LLIRSLRGVLLGYLASVSCSSIAVCEPIDASFALIGEVLNESVEGGTGKAKFLVIMLDAAFPRLVGEPAVVSAHIKMQPDGRLVLAEELDDGTLLKEIIRTATCVGDQWTFETVHIASAEGSARREIRNRVNFHLLPSGGLEVHREQIVTPRYFPTKPRSYTATARFNPMRSIAGARHHQESTTDH
jgi:hypothetical protein